MHKLPLALMMHPNRRVHELRGIRKGEHTKGYTNSGLHEGTLEHKSTPNIKASEQKAHELMNRHCLDPNAQPMIAAMIWPILIFDFKISLLRGEIKMNNFV